MQRGPIEIRLRAEQPEDDEFLYQLYANTRAEEMALTQWPEAQQEMFLRSQFHLQRTHYRRYYPAAAFCVIIQGAQPIGRFYVDRSLTEIRLMEISLIPQCRNRGLGTGLLNQLLQEAANDEKPLTLHVERNNPAARWYERLGFHPVAERGPYLQMEWRPESEPATTLRPAERGGSKG